MNSMLPFFILLSFILYACSDLNQLSAQQTQGKRIFESLCDKCHKLIDPKTLTDYEWTQAVELYGTKLKLQQSDKNAVVAYLTFVNDN